MAARTTRRGEAALRYIAAALFGLATFVALRAMSFYPVWLSSLLTVAVAGLALSSPAIASPVFVVALSLPVAAADAVAGLLALVVGLTTAWLLRAKGGLGFLLAALAVVAVPLHAEWALAPLAGYLVGRRDGAVSALATCLLIEATGLFVGAASLGATATGGAAPWLSIAAPPGGALGFEWVGPAIAAADPGRLLDLAAATQDRALLIAQPLLWVVAAIIGSSFRKPSAGVRALIGVGLAVGFLAASSIALSQALGGPVTVETFALVAGVSLAVALGVTAASEWAFPVVTAKVGPRRGLRQEDAEVDELLRLIASAEDQLATRHHTEAVVMITDMKSFSALTEEVGSLECAKMVQRHRDLLLPVIDRYHGKGKSTGGDGLLAAFHDARAAVDAAIEMQRTLAEFCRSGQIDRELQIRVGIARGEVVLDSGGRPFLGAGLNLAARVMNLADGGRVMTTAEVATTSDLPDALLHPHGPFELKNIAEPVEVVEVLWREDLEPQEL